MSVYGLKNIDEAREFEALIRKRIAKNAEKGDFSLLVENANSLAEAQGAVRVFSLLELMEKGNAPTLERIMDLNDLVACGADDSGSGRGNDGRRSYYDGMRQVLSRQLPKLYRQLDKELNPSDEVVY